MTDDPNREQNAPVTGANKEAQQQQGPPIRPTKAEYRRQLPRRISLGGTDSEQAREEQDRADRDEHHKRFDVRPRRCGAGVAELHFISTFIVEEDIWQTKA
jgi:hypothetical protein